MPGTLSNIFGDSDDRGVTEGRADGQSFDDSAGGNADLDIAVSIHYEASASWENPVDSTENEWSFSEDISLTMDAQAAAQAFTHFEDNYDA